MRKLSERWEAAVQSRSWVMPSPSGLRAVFSPSRSQRVPYRQRGQTFPLPGVRPSGPTILTARQFHGPPLATRRGGPPFNQPRILPEGACETLVPRQNRKQVGQAVRHQRRADGGRSGGAEPVGPTTTSPAAQASENTQSIHNRPPSQEEVVVGMNWDTGPQPVSSGSWTGVDAAPCPSRGRASSPQRNSGPRAAKSLNTIWDG